MSYLTSLTDARDKAAARLAEALASPKPSYMVNGQSVQWSAYCNMLTETIGRLNRLIAEGDVDGTPVEIVSQGYT
jgi:hypothetical protein